MIALHFSSLRSYTRVVSSSKRRTRFDCGACELREGVDLLVVDEWQELPGGDQAIRELRASWLDGIAILRIISKVVRHRICSRAPERQALCDAVGDGTESDVAAEH